MVRVFAHGGPIELFLVPASAPRLVYQRPWYGCGMVHIKEHLLLIEKERKGNVLFNDALNTFYLRLYGV